MKKSNEPERARIQCACTNLKRAARVVGRAYDEKLAPAGINSTQYAILVNIERYQPISQIGLADHLGLERTSLYRAVELMEENGWVRSRPLGEGKTKLLELTAAGTTRLAAGKPLWESVQNSFVRKFGRERWDEMLGAFEEICDYFQ
jgi:DNA-binding MarR family transcriptional regulator